MHALAPLALAFSLASIDDETAPPNFEQHVEPILRESCLKCHRGSRAKNGLELRSVDAILEGGSSGAAIAPGDPGSSLLYLLAAHEREPVMPPSGDKLSEEALATIAAWIEGGAIAVPGGAPAGGAARATEMSYVPPPPVPGTAVMPIDVSTQPVWWTERGTPVRALATSPTAPLAALGGHEQVALYSLPDAELVGVLPFPEGEVHSLSFSANGGLLLVGGGRSAELGVAVGFDVASGARLFAVGNEPDVVLSADVGPDHWLIALGGPDRRLRAYSARTGEPLYELEEHTDWITAVSVSPDGTLLASGDRAGGVFVWEALRGREFHALPAQGGAVTALAWRADSNRLAIAGEDARVRLFEMENGNQVRQWNAKSPVLDMTFLRDGHILTSGRDGRLRLWDQAGAEVRAYGPFEGLAMAAAASHDGAHLLAGDFAGRVHLLSNEAGDELGQLRPNPATDEERAIERLEAQLAAEHAELERLPGAIVESQGALASALAVRVEADAALASARERIGVAEADADQGQAFASEASLVLQRDWHAPLAGKQASVEAAHLLVDALDAEATRTEDSLRSAVVRAAQAEERAHSAQSDTEWNELSDELDTAQLLLEGATASAQMAAARAAESRVALVRREAEAEVWEQRMAPHLASLAEAQARRAELEAELEASRVAAREAEQLLATRQEEERAAQTALEQLEAALIAAGERVPAREAELVSARALWDELRARLLTNGGRVQGGEATAQP